MSAALQSLEPPLFTLPPFGATPEPTTTRQRLSTPAAVRVPDAVLEHIAVVVELQLKYALAPLAAWLPEDKPGTLDDLDNFIRSPGGLSCLGIAEPRLRAALRTQQVRHHAGNNTRSTGTT